MPGGTEKRPVSPEALQTETNLKNALRELEEELLKAGIYKVKSEVAGLAKDIADPFDEGLSIELGSGITTTALVELTFFYENGQEKKIMIDCWEEEGNHLSDPATKETFMKRIKEKLELGKVEDRTGGTGTTIDDLLGEFADQDSAVSAEIIPQEVIQKAKLLLKETARKINEKEITLSDERMRLILTKMTEGTSFEGARVDIRTNGQINIGVDSDGVTVIEESRTVFGEYGSDGAYNVWFEKEKNQWVVACNKVPEGGYFK